MGPVVGVAIIAFAPLGALALIAWMVVGQREDAQNATPNLSDWVWRWLNAPASVSS